MKKNILTSIGLTVFFTVAIVSLNVVTGTGTTSVYAYTPGSPGGRTNSPGDIANVATGQIANCTNCHTGTINVGTGLRTITSTIPSSGYVPGQTYVISGGLTEAGISKMGFEITAEKDADNTKVGTFSVTDQLRTQVVGGAAVTHKAAGTAAIAGVGAWTFNWTAPAAGTGGVTFYGAFNATNGMGTGSGNSSGDHIYTATPLAVSEDLSTGLVENSSLIATSIFPNPVKSSFEISTTKSIDNVVVYNLAGKIMSNINRFENRVDASTLATGVYFVELESEGSVIIKKIIKE